MKKRMKKLMNCLMVSAMTVSMLGLSSVAIDAAMLENNDVVVEATTDAIEVSENGEGQTVYTLKDNVVDGLELQLSNGETVILNGMGKTISGKKAYEINGGSGTPWKDATPAIYVYGNGTLILKDVTLNGGGGGNADKQVWPHEHISLKGGAGGSALQVNKGFVEVEQGVG